MTKTHASALEAALENYHSLPLARALAVYGFRPANQGGNIVAWARPEPLGVETILLAPRMDFLGGPTTMLDAVAIQQETPQGYRYMGGEEPSYPSVAAYLATLPPPLERGCTLDELHALALAVGNTWQKLLRSNAEVNNRAAVSALYDMLLSELRRRGWTKEMRVAHAEMERFAAGPTLWFEACPSCGMSVCPEYPEGHGFTEDGEQQVCPSNPDHTYICF